MGFHLSGAPCPRISLSSLRLRLWVEGIYANRINNSTFLELQACDRDQQCGGGMCCAVSLWIRSLRMCTPMGNVGEECHPLSHRVSRAGVRGCNCKRS